MKVGADKSWKTGIAIALAVISLVMVVRMFMTPVVQQAAASSTTTTTTGAPQQRRRAKVHGKSARANDILASADPRLRLDLLKSSEDVPYAGSGRNIFRAEADIPKPVAPVITQRPVQPAPSQPQVYVPPPPPPINLRFFGFANRPGEAKKIFLSEGDNVYVAGEGEIVGRRYKVVRIGTNTVEIEDVLNNHTQTIPLTQS